MNKSSEEELLLNMGSAKDFLFMKNGSFRIKEFRLTAIYIYIVIYMYLNIETCMYAFFFVYMIYV